MHLLFFIKHDTFFKIYASKLLRKESSHTSKFRKPWTIHKLTHTELPSNGICGIKFNHLPSQQRRDKIILYTISLKKKIEAVFHVAFIYLQNCVANKFK